MESLNLKLAALDSMFDVLQPRQKREYGVTATVMQSLIGRMKGDAPPLPRRYSHLEAFAYSVHGCIAIDEGTEESARRAALHFENQLKVNEAVGDDEGIAMAQANIAIAKSEFEDGDSEELPKVSRDVYELRIAQLGEEDELTILAGELYATSLHNANRRGEARDLLTKLLITSKQVLGPQHNTTKRVESELERL